MRKTSHVTGRTYYPERCQCILNPVQIALYMKNGAMPEDIVVGRDDKLCFMFDRDKTRALFERWRNHELI